MHVKIHWSVIYYEKGSVLKYSENNILQRLHLGQNYTGTANYSNQSRGKFCEHSLKLFYNFYRAKVNNLQKRGHTFLVKYISIQTQ